MELKGYKLLKELCELVGPSGFEQDVQRYIKTSIEDKVSKLEVDALGNFRDGCFDAVNVARCPCR